MKRLTWWVSLSVIASVLVAWAPSSALADDPPPPEVGTVVLEDDLSGPTLFRPSTCRTQRAGLDYVGEGLRLKATGPCNDGDVFAGYGAIIRGLTMLDGEVRLEVKVVGGTDRVRIGIDARLQPAPPGGVKSLDSIPGAYAGAIEPGRGQALIGIPGKPATRKDVSGAVLADEWNTLALRLKGPDTWLLLNDQPVLHFSDASIDSGDVLFDAVRIGDGPVDFLTELNDTTEVAAVYRNLRVSALAEGDPARMPRYQRP